MAGAGATWRTFFFLEAASAPPMPSDNAAITAMKILTMVVSPLGPRYISIPPPHRRYRP